MVEHRTFNAGVQGSSPWRVIEPFQSNSGTYGSRHWAVYCLEELPDSSTLYGGKATPRNRKWGRVRESATRRKTATASNPADGLYATGKG